MRKLLRFICEPIFRERMQIKYILNHDRSGFLNYIMTEHLRGKYNLILSKDAEIEEDVWFPHPHNIIVGGVVKIGKKCVLYHDVTLGQNRGEYPIVGNGVIIYAGAKVIGNVKISTVTGNSSNRAYFYATAFELIFSIVFRIPIQTVRSVNTSTMLPWSVNGASCKTDRSFIMPLWTMYSTI